MSPALFQLFNAKVTKQENRITLENTKRAYDEIFAFTAMLWVCSLVTLDSFTRQMKNISEDERKLIKERIFNSHIDNFKDARKILHI